MISQQALGTEEIVVIHHVRLNDNPKSTKMTKKFHAEPTDSHTQTDCGMLTFHDDALRSKIKAEPPKPNAVSSVSAALDAIAFLPFSDIDQSVKDDVTFLKEHPLVLAKTKISGYVFDVADGKLRKID